MVIFTEGYTEKQLAAIERSVTRFGGTMVRVNSSKELVNYVNAKSTECMQLTPERTNDKITNMDIYAHGVVGKIEFGYHMEKKGYEAEASFDESSSAGLSKGAFKGLASCVTSYACRTGSGNKDIDWAKGMFQSDQRDESLAQDISNSSGAVVKAYFRRSSYVGTLGNAVDRRMSTLYPVPQQQNIDGAAFTPNGSNRPVTPGSSPVGTDPNQQTYTPKMPR